ncbi:MAG TPA: hypothetical protein PLO33_13035 [Kouleothrix sp.]|uniref:hypothetical protein n=1 Tax=Kouleothrix sp. TaxID=2779161 RepID=UPI002BA5B900|nr:hypothetical protein [Kouleothrix sp.]
MLELHNILEHRRRLYEQQIAKLEPNVPHDVRLGLASTVRELEMVEAKLRLPPIGLEVQEAVPEGPALTLELRMRQLERDMRQLLGGLIEDIAAQRAESAIWRETQEAWRAAIDSWRRTEDLARRLGQRRTLIVVGGLALVQLAALLLIVWIAATLHAHGL